MIKIALKPSRIVRRERHDSVATSSAWLESPPFVVNPRGILIHRVKDVTVIYWSGKVSHFNAGYLCGNSCNIEKANIDEVLTDDPPKNRLLCERCELIAIKEKLPTGDKLAGRHVHRGVLVPQQTCCLN